MLLLSLSEGAGSGVVEVVSSTKAKGLEVSGSRKESDFSSFYQNFNLCVLTNPICFLWRIISFQAFPMLFSDFQSQAHLQVSIIVFIFELFISINGLYTCLK